MKLPFASLLRWRSASESRPTGAPTTAFQFMSDLHLEVGQQYATYEIPVAEAARYLILGGDIGRLIDYEGMSQFLHRQTAVFDKVFLVLGNHEFYGLSYDEGQQRARDLVDAVGEKLVLLQQGHQIIREPGRQIHVLGCTLWSRIPVEKSAEVAARVQDFSRITGWSVKLHNQHHDEDLAWLKGELSAVREEEAKAKARGEEERFDAVVVTHHAPWTKGTSSPEHAGNPWACAFATDVLSGRGRDAAWLSTVRWWVYGHTHYTSEVRVRSLSVVSNQRGYVFPGAAASTREEDTAHGFDATRVLRV